jgi:fumarate reductase subunit D
MPSSTPSNRRHVTGYRRDLLWIAALVHRVSGILLALFLPLHFLVLGLAIDGEAKLETFLAWTQQPLVKLAETLLVALLGLHLLGGLRILAVESHGYLDGQKRIAAVVFLMGGLIGLGFALVAFQSV